MKLALSSFQKGLKISVFIGIAATIAGLLLPNLSDVREKARRVEDLANLNAIYKAISPWGLAPSGNGMITSLDQLVKHNLITADMLVNRETGKPIEYYPVSSNSDGNHAILISRGKHGMCIVKAAGQGVWIDNGAPQDEDSVWVGWVMSPAIFTALLAGCWLVLRIRRTSQHCNRNPV